MSVTINTIAIDDPEELKREVSNINDFVPIYGGAEDVAPELDMHEKVCPFCLEFTDEEASSVAGHMMGKHHLHYLTEDGQRRIEQYAAALYFTQNEEEFQSRSDYLQDTEGGDEGGLYSRFKSAIGSILGA